MCQRTCAVLGVVLLSGSVIPAQESGTKVKAKDAKVMTLTGCLEIGGATSFILSNVTSEREPHKKSTSSAGGPSYALSEREGLDLGPYVNQTVQLTGVVIPPATSSDPDQKIKIKETSGSDSARSPKSAAATTVKVRRGAATQLLVASVKPLAPTCR